MNKKIIVTLIVLLFCVSCISIVSADNDTNDTLQSDDTTQSNDTLQSNASEEVVMSTYIAPVSINGNVIEFNDDFTGFYLDLTKSAITSDDRFARESTGSDGIQNYVKLAILEAYKQGCEDDLGQIIASFADGSYKSSNNKVISAVLKSQETIGDSAVVELEDSTKGTFEFELLKDVKGKKSDCLAYRISLRETPDGAKLTTITDSNVTEQTNDTDNNTSDDTQNTTDTTDNKTDEKQNTTNTTNNKTDENKTAEKTTNTTDNKTDEKQNTNNKTNNKTDKNETANKTTNATDNKTDDSNQNKETLVNVTNKTILNKTNTLIINENNTTTINKNNIKTINKTTETQKKETIQDKLIKTVGNPIFLLILVIAIAAIVAVVMRRN